METVKPKKIGSLAVLKFVAMLSIILWHIGINSQPFNYGAFAVDFLFVSSGFLVGYNHFFNGMPNTIRYCFKYTYDKLKKFWPLHVICLIAYCILSYFVYSRKLKFESIPTLLANFFLLQSWSSDVNVIFSFNYVSWFLSTLLFCYFISPFLISFIREKKIAVPLFFFVAMLRIFVDVCITYNCNIFNFYAHSSPIVRALEFFMGMLMVPVFYWIKEKIVITKMNRLFISILEVAILISTFFVLKIFDTKWERSYFVLVACIIVFVFAFDSGYFSVLCNKKFILNTTSIQLEMYLLQPVMHLLITLLLNNYDWLAFMITIIELITISIIYKFSLEDKFIKLFDKIELKIHKKQADAVLETHNGEQ